MKTKLPSALIYGWDRFGIIQEKSRLLEDEWLAEDVIIHSYESDNNFEQHFSELSPDVIITFGDKSSYTKLLEFSNDSIIQSKWTHYDIVPDVDTIYNLVAINSTNWSCLSTSDVYEIGRAHG